MQLSQHTSVLSLVDNTSSKSQHSGSSNGGNYDKALESLEDAVELGRKKAGKRSEKVADSLQPTLKNPSANTTRLSRFDEQNWAAIIWMLPGLFTIWAMFIT